MLLLDGERLNENDGILSPQSDVSNVEGYMDYKTDFSVLILTCDKYLDLAPWIKQTCERFFAAGLDCLIAGECQQFSCGPAACFLCTQETCFSLRMARALEQVKSKYVLVLLDDYFVHDECLLQKADIWLQTMKRYDLDALKVSKQLNLYAKLRKVDLQTKKIKKIEPYTIDFHPTVWKTGALKTIVNGQPLTAWELEPKLSRYFKTKLSKAMQSDALIEYDELIVGGKFFRKPFRKYCRQLYRGDRRVLGRISSLKYALKSKLLHLCPPWVKKWIKKTFFPKRKFYSDNF